MQREYSGQFDFGPSSAALSGSSSSSSQSHSSKQQRKRSTAKSDKKRGRGGERGGESGEGGGSVGMAEAPRVEEPHPTTVPLQRLSSPPEPGYQSVTTATAAAVTAGLPPPSLPQPQTCEWCDV